MKGYLYIDGEPIIPTIIEGITPSIQSLNITPSTSAQTFIPSGIDGYGPVTVSAVTSSIDANITAENIKKDVEILCVTGTLESSPIKKWFNWKEQDSIITNYNIIGSPTIQNHILSDINYTSYLTAKTTFSPQNNETWEVRLKIKTPVSWNTYSAVFTSMYSNNCGIWIGFRGQEWNFAVSTDGLSWDSNVSFYGNNALSDTVYWIKAGYDGTQYYFKYSTDGETYTTEWSTVSSSKVYNNLTTTFLGVRDSDGASQSTFNGSIYLDDVKCFINDQVVWTPYTIVTGNSVFTDIITPTISTTIYSEPFTLSALTITSIGTGTITCSDTKVYSRNSAGDEDSVMNITENGTYDVTEYVSAIVDMPTDVLTSQKNGVFEASSNDLYGYNVVNVNVPVETAVKQTWYQWQCGTNSINVGTASSFTNSGYKSAIFGDNKFVVIGNGVTAYSVDNGVTWTETTLTKNYTGITFGNNYFVAVGSSNALAYALKGNMTWNENTTFTSNTYYKVVYGKAKFVAIGPQCFAYSYAGYPANQWTEGSLTGFYEDIACDGNKFVAVGLSGYAYSIDGITWTEGSLTRNEYQSICYGNGKFVAVGDKYFAYSADGITWTETNFGELDDYDMIDTVMDAKSIDYTNGLFVVTGRNCYAYSVDGINWFEYSYNGIFTGICDNHDNMFALVGSNFYNVVSITKPHICYTDTSTPTTSTKVYSEPYISLSSTIAFVSSDYSYIQLSDGYDYSKTDEIPSNYSYTFGIKTVVDTLKPVIGGTTQSPQYNSSIRFSNNLNIVSVDLSSLTHLDRAGVLKGSFSGCKNLREVIIDNLISINNDSDPVVADSFSQTFYNCESLKTLDFKSLETTSGSKALGNMCQNCISLETVLFPKLNYILNGSNGVFYQAFYGCKKLKDVYFNALTTASFGNKTNQFQNMFNSSTGSESGGCTIHFPSNLSSTISGLTGYAQNFGGGSSGYVTLAFDLPATS